jgi:hypothetical protein
LPGGRGEVLNHNSFDLIERDFVAGAIVELGRARAFVRGHGLRVFQRAPGFQIGSDARGAESVAADPDPRAEIGGAALNHAPGVNPVHGRGGKRAGAAGRGAEEGLLSISRMPAASI